MAAPSLAAMPTGVKRYLNAARTGFLADAFAHTARGVEYLRKSGTGAHTLTTRKQGGHAQCPTNEAMWAMAHQSPEVLLPFAS